MSDNEGLVFRQSPTTAIPLNRIQKDAGSAWGQSHVSKGIEIKLPEYEGNEDDASRLRSNGRVTKKPRMISRYDRMHSISEGVVHVELKDRSD